ncbi:MAG TPA: chorismate mutase [Longimicrobiales bacterium]|nr:chorismate mutase [Longimicrobiales bacterium]
MSPAEWSLEELRREIERIDRELVGLLSERMDLAREAGRRKRATGQPTLDPAREAEVVRRAGEFAREANVPEEEVREIFWHLIGLSRRAQLESGE